MASSFRSGNNDGVNSVLSQNLPEYGLNGLKIENISTGLSFATEPDSGMP